MKNNLNDLIQKHTNLKILEKRICKWCDHEFMFFDLQKQIEEKIGIKYNQDLCYSCSIRRLMMFRNETNIYRNVCSSCKKEIVSLYTPESKEAVYCLKCFDEADFIEKEKNNKINPETIIEDFYNLYLKTPKKALVNDQTENAEYANYAGFSKNIYLSYLTYTGSSDIFYSYYTVNSKDCIDNHGTRNCEKCYESVNIFDSYNCFYSNNLVNCSDTYFSINIKDSKHCLFSSNLVNKEYYIYNKKYSKKEYQKIFENLKKNLGNNKGIKKLKDDYLKLEKNTIYKNLQILNTENSLGDYMFNSTNTLMSFYCTGIENSVNVWGNIISDSVNLIGGGNIERCYNSCSVGYDCQNIIGTFNTVTSSNILNSISVFYSNDILFSCSIKNKKNSILNVEYGKEEYKKYRKEIISYLKENNEYGDFLPLKFSRIPYNDSSAMESFPIKKVIYPDGTEKIIDNDGLGNVQILEPNKFLSKAILDLGGKQKLKILWKTHEKEVNIPEGIKLMSVDNFPDDIVDIDTETEQILLSSALVCEESGRPYRIMKYELDFYKKNGLSLPRIHPKIRHLKRQKQIQPRELNIVECSKCKQSVLTSHSIKKAKIIYCEKCYNNLIY